MLELGIILLIVGVVLLLAPVPFPNKDAVGWLIAFIALVLIVVAVVAANCTGVHC